MRSSERSEIGNLEWFKTDISKAGFKRLGNDAKVFGQVLPVCLAAFQRSSDLALVVSD
jgi:hypothetical protein